MRPQGVEAHSTNQQPHGPSGEQPTQELPVLNLAPQAQAAPAPARSLLRALASQLVTLLLIVAVAGVLVINVGPLFLPYKVYTVLSGSMAPTIPTGSEVLLRPVAASEIQVGDVITFQRPGNARELVTHRVVGTTKAFGGQAFWLTKGDANGANDNWQIPASGTGLKYAFHIPFIGYAFAMLGSPIGRICFILAPALLLTAVVLNDLWKPREPRTTPAREPARKGGR